MLKILFTIFAIASVSLAQTSSDGSFSVRHAKRANFSLSSAQMREAESLYRSACAVVRHEFPSAGDLHPQFTVVIGADRNESRFENTGISAAHEIWLKKWDPILFADGVVSLAFDQMLTPDRIKQWGLRAVHQSDATVGVAELK